MSEQELDEAMMRDVQLHEELRLIYVVDGWEVGYSTDDGETYQNFWGKTPLEAMKVAFSEVRNIRGRR